MEIREILKELKKHKIEKHFFTLKEAARILGVHPNILKVWIDQNLVLGIKMWDRKKGKEKFNKIKSNFNFLKKMKK